MSTTEGLEAAVNAAFAAVLAWQKEAREALWRLPSRRQVEATIRAQYDRAEALQAKLDEIDQAIGTFFTVHADRTDAAEAKVVALVAALRRHAHTFTDSTGVVLCGGCLEPAPCPDAALCAEEPLP